MDDIQLIQPTGVQLRSVPALRGALWVQSGLRLFFQQPLGFAALFICYFFGALMLSAVPFFGSLVVATLTPAITLAFMRAVQLTLAGKGFGVSVLIEVWRTAAPTRQRQIKLGLLYSACVLAVAALMVWLISGTPAWNAMLQGTPEGREAAAQDPAFLQALLIALAAYAPVSLAFWHAPALVQWTGQSVGKAIFFSLMACWHNRWAFAVFGLVWGGTVFTAGLVAAMLATALNAPQAFELAMMPLAVLFGASFYASMYFSIVECFELKVDVAPSNQP